MKKVFLVIKKKMFQENGSLSLSKGLNHEKRQSLGGDGVNHLSVTTIKYLR